MNLREHKLKSYGPQYEIRRKPKLIHRDSKRKLFGLENLRETNPKQPKHYPIQTLKKPLQNA